MRLVNKYIVILSVVGLMPATLFLTSCHRREVKLRMDAIGNRAEQPVLDAQQVTTLISDSGVTRFRITASKWQVYDKATPPHWEFVDGILLEQFDHNLRTAATLRSDYAYYNEEAELWHLTGNVFATNVNGEQFDTEELFWNQKTERVYSDSAITITQPASKTGQDGGGVATATVIKGVGFESNQEMTHYTIRRPTGVFPIEN